MYNLLKLNKMNEHQTIEKLWSMSFDFQIDFKNIYELVLDPILIILITKTRLVSDTLENILFCFIRLIHVFDTCAFFHSLWD